MENKEFDRVAEQSKAEQEQEATRAPGIATRSKKLLGAPALRCTDRLATLRAELQALAQLTTAQANPRKEMQSPRASNLLATASNLSKGVWEKETLDGVSLQT